MVLRFDTGVPARMGPACDRFYAAVVGGELTHHDDPVLARHVAHCRTRDTRHGRVVTKDHKDSPRKIDVAVAAVIAHDVAVTARSAPPPFRSIYEDQDVLVLG